MVFVPIIWCLCCKCVNKIIKNKMKQAPEWHGRLWHRQDSKIQSSKDGTAIHGQGPRQQN